MCKETANEHGGRGFPKRIEESSRGFKGFSHIYLCCSAEGLAEKLEAVLSRGMRMSRDCRAETET